MVCGCDFLGHPECCQSLPLCGSRHRLGCQGTCQNALLLCSQACEGVGFEGMHVVISLSTPSTSTNAALSQFVPWYAQCRGQDPPSNMVVCTFQTALVQGPPSDMVVCTFQTALVQGPPSDMVVCTFQTALVQGPPSDIVVCTFQTALVQGPPSDMERKGGGS